MKKLIVKAELIDIPYSPAIEPVEAVEGSPEHWFKEVDGEIIKVFEKPPKIVVTTNEAEKWIKDGEEVYSAPEDLDGWEYVPASETISESEDDSWAYSPAIEAVAGVEGKPEQPEVKSWHILGQTQGTDEELALWLEGDKHKYPEGYVVEYIDISAEVEQAKINQEALEYLAKTDWLIIRAIDAGVPCPEDVKAARQAAREKIVHI